MVGQAAVLRHGGRAARARSGGRQFTCTAQRLLGDPGAGSEREERTVRARLDAVRTRRVAEAPPRACSAPWVASLPQTTEPGPCRHSVGVELRAPVWPIRTLATGLPVLRGAHRGRARSSADVDATGDGAEAPRCALAGSVAVRSRGGVMKTVRVQALPVRNRGRNEGTTPCTSRPQSACTAPGFLDTRLRYAAWRSSYSSRASSGVRYASFSRRQHWL